MIDESIGLAFLLGKIISTLVMLEEELNAIGADELALVVNDLNLNIIKGVEDVYKRAVIKEND